MPCVTQSLRLSHLAPVDGLPNLAVLTDYALAVSTDTIDKGNAMRINAKVIPHAEQRYNTVGDWWFHADPEDGGLIMEIRVSDMGRRAVDCDYEALLLVHEIVEAWLCWRRGITDEQVTTFDKKFEAEGNDGEPGTSVDAPYHREHIQAELLEQGFAVAMGTSWPWYEVELRRVASTWPDDR